MTQFANPYLLWLLAVLPLMAAWYVIRLRKGGATLRISTVEGFRKAPRTPRYWLRHLPFVLRCAAVAMLVVALARPRSSELNSTTTVEGIDIVLAIDVSGSMLARDFKPDRITAAKEVAARFIADRPADRIGLVVFAGESYTQSPLTTDRSSLLSLLSQIREGIVEDGTAIGNGLATSVNRLKESDAKSKVVILLTDGVNNSGQIAPLTAAKIAAQYGIRVYTVGVGSRGTAPMPAYDMWGNLILEQRKVEIDEQTLTQIAEDTGGAYFRATDKDSLKAIYDRINTLEKSKIDTNEFTRYHELFARWLLLALAALLAEFLLTTLYLKRIP
ncbi:MAG: VWA domain-containing protein [Rikenellaceae bacterium]|nr:VWA domain-containing protein [Rikenellaceae bacterium]